MNPLWRLLKVAILAFLGMSIALAAKSWVLWHDAGQMATATIAVEMSATSDEPNHLTESESLVFMVLYDTPEESAAFARQALAAQAVTGKSRDAELERHILARLVAIRLHRKASDVACMKAFLRTAHFGKKDYGMDAAITSLFPDSSGTLNMQQAVTLAALITAPELRKDPDRLQQRIEALKKRLQERIT